MQHQVGMAVCWCIQPMARVQPYQIPGRIVGLERGYVCIRVFDEERARWIKGAVRPITVRGITPQQLTLLEQQEATWPVTLPSGSGEMGQNQEDSANRFGNFMRSRSQVRLRSTGGQGDLNVRIASANTLPGASQRSLPSSKPQRSLEEISDLRESIGRVRDPDTDLAIRLAYRVLIVGETLGRVGLLAEMSRERVRQYLRLGVIYACKGDPKLEKLLHKPLPVLRRHAPVLKPALQTAFLTMPAATVRRVASARVLTQRQ